MLTRSSDSNPYRRRHASTWTSLLASLCIACACAVKGVTAQSGAGINLEEMDTMFSFGDSYSATGYIPKAGHVKQPRGMGRTSSGGYNWVQYLAYSQSGLASSYYDLAFSGATTNNSVVKSNVPDFITQVDLFEWWFAGENSEVEWESETTLFTIWFGINDVGFATVGNMNGTAIQDPIMETYARLIKRLHSYGARKFLILGIPPTQRTPFFQTTNDVIIANAARYIGEYNSRLYYFANSLPATYPDSVFALFDTQGFFNALLDQPRLYGFKETKTSCNQYSERRNSPNASLPICKHPLREYVWYDTYHPSWAVHKLLASVLVNMLTPATSRTNPTHHAKRGVNDKAFLTPAGPAAPAAPAPSPAKANADFDLDRTLVNAFEVPDVPNSAGANVRSPPTSARVRWIDKVGTVVGKILRPQVLLSVGAFALGLAYWGSFGRDVSQGIEAIRRDD
ncbi:hypothetical protein JCM10212_000599 [Sporobolomyces blumeae]